MKIAALIQARMSSSRLPGKVLSEMGGRPMLAYLVERLERCEALGPIVIATSERNDDDRIEAFCQAKGIACHRGALDDVAGRLIGAARAFDFECFVRVNGDSPLLDPELVSTGIGLMVGGEWDLVTNLLPRSYPKGQSVEVIRRRALEEAHGRMTTDDEREHVTKFIYAHASEFRIRNFPAPAPAAKVQLSVDDKMDFERIERLIGRMTRPHWEYGVDNLLTLLAASDGGQGEG